MGVSYLSAHAAHGMDKTGSGGSRILGIPLLVDMSFLPCLVLIIVCLAYPLRIF